MRSDTVRRESGFSLVELLIALVVVSLALALATQILMETSQMLADSAAEQIESPLPLVRARLRGDIQAAARADILRDKLGRMRDLRLSGPAGTVVYRQEDGVLWRGDTPLLRGVRSWECVTDGSNLVVVTIVYRARAPRRTPLPNAPSARGPLEEERTETLLAAPRGAGLVSGW